MRVSSPFVLLLFVFLLTNHLSVAVTPAHGRRTAQAPVQPPAGQAVHVFVVSGDASTTDKTLDALVVVERGRFRQPYPDQDAEAAKRFAEQHFRAGQKFRLTFGGGGAGTFTVRGAGEGCNNVHADGTAETTANIGGRVMALATDSDGTGRRESARRAPTASERKAVLELANRIYRQRRTPSALLERLQVTNLTATDLDGDGRFEIIGSFTLETKQKARRDLFLIAAPKGTGFRADLIDFKAYRLPPEGFDSSVDFVDQLDLDGDRIGEVVTLDHGFDAYGYSIYKKRRGRWSRVYSAAGDAC